ncbi:polysaccharide pyruvyl transferase family protein [Sinomicrobium sp. M5D2P9]
MKKTGLLTMPVKENYGGIVQIAALYAFLESNGYTPYLIRKKYDESLSKRIFRYILSHNPLYFLYDYKNLTKREKQSSKLQSFVEQFFTNKTTLSFNKEQYQKSVQNLDAVIVGSDQVWRYKYVGKNYRYYFLDYLPSKTKKIAYAASFGVDQWEGNQETVQKVESLLNQFSTVSVREKSGLEICKKTFNCQNAVHVLDPTFLPEVSFYNNLIDKEKIQKKVRLFSYVLDNSDFVKEAITHTSKSLNLEVDTIKLTDYKFSANPSIAEWLYHFREADFVITDSFHGTVFSILFKKQFICVGNKKRGYSRFESLLELLNLKERLIFDYTPENLNKLLKNKIDYNAVRVLKQKQIEISKDFLLNGLKNG